VFQVLLADFIDTHKKFIASPLAEYHYCQVPGMQSSVLMGMHNLEKDKVWLFLSRLRLQSCQVPKWEGGGMWMHTFNRKNVRPVQHSQHRLAECFFSVCLWPWGPFVPHQHNTCPSLSYLKLDLIVCFFLLSHFLQKSLNHSS